MDKSKWEYKKLGEVCNLYQPKTISSDMLIPDGKYLVYGANGVIGKYNEYNHENSEVLMTCRGATCGTINVSAPYSWINGNAMVVHPRINDLSAQFLVYQLKAADKTSVITGAAQPQITRQMLQTLPFIVAPIADQQRIVAELDCLNEMIALKQEQLKEFDKLAQSIFYDMFGDPSMNDKGWDVATLKSICTKITDGTHDTPKRITSGVKFITGKHIRPFYVDYDNSDYVTEDVHREIYSRCNPEFGDVLYTNIGAGVGNAALNTVEYEFSMKNVALLKPKQDLVCGLYITHYLNEPGIKKTIIDNHTNGGAQIFLSLKAIGDIPVSLPPLALQQQFAEKIQAIEAQKELVKQSIAETQQLLDSRMDYYFD